MSQHGYMRHMTTPPLVLEIGQKLWQYYPILTTLHDLLTFNNFLLQPGEGGRPVTKTMMGSHCQILSLDAPMPMPRNFLRHYITRTC